MLMVRLSGLLKQFAGLKQIIFRFSSVSFKVLCKSIQTVNVMLLAGLKSYVTSHKVLNLLWISL